MDIRGKEKKPKGGARRPLSWWEGQKDNSGNGGMESSRMQETLGKEGRGTCDQWAHIVMNP